ncbi:MAG: hypothetical protein NTZ33_14495 [Bacteroidetes bacterium]|nr:hypothetical protein [Bacteroidota bacterium]
MVLTKQTKFGLTFGQIMSLLIFFGGLITAYTDLNVKIASVQAKTDAKIEHLELGRQTNAANIEIMRQENRQDHNKLNDKIDILLINIKKP